MIGYRDMTFCTFHEDCAQAEDCHRPLTEDVARRADKWAKSHGLEYTPILQFSKKPECHERKS